uniref:Uncharacterized protein n=1 Tax=Ananas comosus var. bracteatus TaxID=296719 RepID=A0A6V7QHW0_ANACO|nr:unnamed protein product [Ananas comosus var. bracteatus]
MIYQLYATQGVGFHNINQRTNRGISISPSYDHIQASFPDNTPQREVLGLSFPIHNEVSYFFSFLFFSLFFFILWFQNFVKGTSMEACTNIFEVHPTNIETFKTCNMESSSQNNKDPSPNIVADVTRKKLSLNVSSIIESQTGGAGTMEDDISPYDDELVDYRSTPSPPKYIEDPLTDVTGIGVSSFSEAYPTHHEDVPFDENVDIRLDSGARDFRSETPIIAKSFLIDRIMDTMKTFNCRKFRLEVADDSLKKLTPTEEELQKDVIDAEKEHAAAIEGCNDSKESTGLRELIELFEERCQIFEI